VAAAIDEKGETPWNPDDEITVERRVRVPAAVEPSDPSRRRTTQMARVDSRLLAIARGELEPDPIDPFGGLIPVLDEEPSQEIDDGWLILETEPSPESPSAVLAHIRPRLRLRSQEIAVLPVGDRTALFVSAIDGKRTINQLGAACSMDDLETLEIVDELVRMGVIELH
jgi:hypothetical protein